MYCIIQKQELGILIYFSVYVFIATFVIRASQLKVRKIFHNVYYKGSIL